MNDDKCHWIKVSRCTRCVSTSEEWRKLHHCINYEREFNAFSQRGKNGTGTRLFFVSLNEIIIFVEFNQIHVKIVQNVDKTEEKNGTESILCAVVE